MKSNVVTLTFPEMYFSAQNGLLRRVSSMQQGLNCDNAVEGKSNWESDASGAIAEMAYAKFANVFWSPSINTFKKPDVGNVQVRSTSHADGHLIIRPNDNDQDPYVLITGKYQTWTIQGWITGKQAKHPKFWREDKQSYWVPISELEDISTLPRETA